MRRLNKLMLPIGLPLVLAIGLVLPSPGAFLADVQVGPKSLGDLLVVPIFFVYGLQTKSLPIRTRTLGRAIATVLVVNLVLGPILGLAAIRLVDLPLGIEVGVALMASVPTTLSSAVVIAVNVGGDRLWALSLTISTVLVGSITAPLAVSAILSADVSLDPVSTLASVILVVVVPTAVGHLIGRMIQRDLPGWFDLIPSVMVLLVVWMTVSANAETVWDMAPGSLVVMLMAALLVHSALLAVALAASRGLPVAHAMPLVFVAAQKTLPMALTILTIISRQEPQVAEVAAVAAIGCVVWHFTQLLGDSAIGGRLAAGHERRRQSASSGSVTA